MIDFHPPLLVNYIVPANDSPNAFGAVRKHDIHTGVDLFCQPFEPVYAMEDGIVMAVFPFTGELANTPWWNDTDGVLIKGSIGSFLYGEIHTDLQVGETVTRGQCIGYVVTVLKKDKGVPMTMLHMELYDQSYVGNGVTHHTYHPKPNILFNPSFFLSKGYQRYIEDFEFCGITVREENNTFRKCGGKDMPQYTTNGLRALSILGANSDTLTAFLMSETMKTKNDIHFAEQDSAVDIERGVVMSISNGLKRYGGMSEHVKQILVVTAMLNLWEYRKIPGDDFEAMRRKYSEIIENISQVNGINYHRILDSFEKYGIFS